MGLKDLELFAQQESQHSQASSAVGASLDQGLDQNPDEYAKLLSISARTGVVPAIAKDFRPQLEKRVRINEMSIDDMVRTHPKTAQFLSDRDNASISHDDVGVLKTIEDTLLAVPAGLVQGWDKQRQMFLNYKEVVGNISPAERAELEKLDEIAKERSKEYSKGLPSWFKAASDVVGMSANNVLDALKYEGTVGMGTGAATGATLGLIGGPTAPVTATAGGATGALVGLKAGTTVGVVTNTYESSVGETYDDLKNFRLPDGTKLDPTVARYASIVAGVPNTALETFALGKALKLIPYADKVVGTIGREGMKEILSRPTMRASLAEIGKNYATAVGTETFTEGLQKFVSILAREAAIAVTPEGGPVPDPDWYTKTQAHSKQAWQPTTLQPVEEVKFREWMYNTKLFNSIKYDIAMERDTTPDRVPNAAVLDVLDKQGDYDYRGAWKSGITEVMNTRDANRPHWPSKGQDGAWLKSPTHPTAWMEYFMQETGKDPQELGLDTIEQAREWSLKQLTTPKADQRQGRSYDEQQLRQDAAAIVDESTEAFKASVVLGGMGGGVKTYQARQEVKRADETQAVFQAIADAATDSKTNKRVPERFQQFVEQATKDGPVQNVYIGAQEFSTFFQSQGVDPEQVAAEVGVTNYRAAMAAGSDIVIPISQFASKLAPSQYLQGIAPDMRLRQGDMSLREAQLYQAEQEARDAELLANMEQIVAEQQAAGGFSRAVTEIMTDIEGQLLSIGMTDQMARDEAVKLRGVAVLVERDMKERAARTGQQVSDEQVLEAIRGVWDRYGLTINRQIPDVLTTAPTSDITIDPLLDSLRAGNFPSDAEIFGQSLSEFIRSKGGIKPQGEFTDMNAGTRPFQSKLIRAQGMDIGLAAEAAVEAGYFPDRDMATITDNEFLDALDADINGNAVYSVLNTNNDVLAIREAMNSLGDYLDSLGIDLQAVTSNAGVRRLLDNARRDPMLEGVVNELEQFVNGMATQQGENTLYQQITEVGKNAITGDLERVNPAVREAVDARIARLPAEEQQRIRDNLEKFKSTAWAAAAVKGMAYREMLERAMIGQDIANLEVNEIWGKQDMSATKLIKAFKKFPEHGDRIIKALIGSYDFIGGNRKAENDVSTSFTNCDPSAACATHCYAAGSNARPSEIAKSEFTEFMLEYFPEEMADKIAGDYMATAAGKAGLSLRLNDKGDLSAAQVTLVNNLNARGIAVQVFSKRPELLRQLSDMNLKMLSVDSTNIDVARANTDLSLAVTITDDMTQDMLQEINDRVAVYLPVNLKGRAWTAEELQAAFPDLYQQMKRETLCPVDGGRKTTKPDTSFVNILDKTSEKNVWTCTACDYTGAAGCFNGDRKTNKRKASVVMVSDLQKELQQRKVRKELQANLDQLLALGGIDGELHKQLSEALSSGQRAAQSLAGYSSETGTVAGSGDAAQAFAAGREGAGSDAGDSTLYQSVSAAPTFYSQLARAVEGAKQAKAPASDWMAIISKLPSVKAEEIEATGLKDYLELRGKEQVTKEEISSYLAQNGVQVQEVMKSGPQIENEPEIIEEENGAFRIYSSDGALVDKEYYDTEVEAQEALDALVADNTQYGDYTLAGGENYRELLLTLPPKMSEQDTKRMMKLEADRRRYNYPFVFDDSPEGQELQALQAKSKENVYRNRHWSEENVLAHIRFNERTDADGNRVLFIEELQSDWAQEGRKKGFAGDKEKVKAYQVSINGNPVTAYETREEADAHVARAAKYNDPATISVAEVMVEVNDVQGEKKVPSAPFVTDTKGWLNLALKRMIRYAAENGFDKVAFVNGKQSAERYALSKAVSDMSWTDRPDGGRMVMMALTDGTPVQLIVDKDANVTKAKNLAQAEGKPLDEIVGKDLATKIMTEQGGDLEGVQMDVGGEGMKAFYDKIVPNAVSSLIKKMDGKVEPVEFRNQEGRFTIIDTKSGKQVGRFQTLDEANSFMNQAKSAQSRGTQMWFDANDLQHQLDNDRTQQLGFTVTDKMREMAMAGQALFQGNDDKRGMIQFGQNRKFSITLLEKANASTVTHELGHFYLEVLGDLATAEGAGESVVKDYQTILNFLGAKSREDLTLDGKTKGSAEYNAAVAMHEKFARANEAYWMEGKAPIPELQSVFQRFKHFIAQIYKQIEALNVRLNDDVRAVFDRIYASDAEIEAAKDQVNVDPLLIDAATAGMSEQEFNLYREGVAKATESGKEALLAKLMREMMRTRKTWWKEERAKMKELVTKEVDDQPVYRAFATLLAGKGEDDDTPIKLNKQALVDRYGADYVKKLPRSFGRIYTTTGGMDADSAAEMLGYDSGDKLIEALVGMRDRKELIEAETDARMLQKHGDMLNDGSIADEAKVALHNTQREDMLMTELKALRRKQREVAPFVNQAMRAERSAARSAADVPPAEAFRRAAQGIVDQTAPRDLNPYTYLQAARKAAKQAFDAMSKGDYQLAANAKQKELLNHFLYLEATKAREEADKILAYARKFEKRSVREKMGKAGASYLEQIDGILDRYEFRRVPLSKLDRRDSLKDWINAQEAEGNEPSIDPILLNDARQVNYRNVPMAELRAIRDGVRNIEHLARFKNKLLAKQAEIAFEDGIAELVSAAENMTAGKGDKPVGKRKPLPLDNSLMTRLEKTGDTLGRVDAMLLKMEQIVEWLDNGNVNGAWHTYIWNPIVEAQTKEYDLTEKITKKLAASLEKMPKAQRLSMLDTFEVAGIGKVNRKILISIALNMGSQSNIDKLMKGMGWSMGTIEGALANLNDADWTFVQETWDTINLLWPEIEAMEKRMTGLAPEKVQAQPYEVRDANGNVTRTLAGGYYPLVYDPRKSIQGAKQDGGNLGQLFEDGYVRATTPKGHTQARMEGFAAPFVLDFEQIITQHMAKVIKDLTHREAVVQANKIMHNPEIRTVLQETLGEHYEKQFLPWLRSVVNDRNGGSVQGVGDFSRWMMAARANVVAATMGFKATTMIAQITGLSQSLDKVKGRYLGQALLDFMRHPIAITRQVREMSGEMRHRSNTLDRDIRDQLRTLTGQNSAWANAQKFAFHGIALADAMVTIPTWLGAYRQSIDGGVDEATALLEADAAVRMTQGAGGAKDLAAIQRNNELAKSLTMFYSYFSVLYNRQRDMGRDVQQIRDMPRFLSRVFFTIMMPAVLGELILGRGPDDDEDPAAWVIRKVLLYPLMSLPVLRDVVSSIDSGYDYRFSPMATLFDKVAKAVTATGKVITDDMEWGDYSLRVAETIGYVFGVAGTAQMSATGKYLWRVSEGEEQPDNMAELLAYALLGKKKD